MKQAVASRHAPAVHARIATLARRQQAQRRRECVKSGRAVRSNGRPLRLAVSWAAPRSGCSPPRRAQPHEVITLRATERPAHVISWAEAVARPRAGLKAKVWSSACLKLAAPAMSGAAHRSIFFGAFCVHKDQFLWARMVARGGVRASQAARWMDLTDAQRCSRLQCAGRALNFSVSGPSAHWTENRLF